MQDVQGTRVWSLGQEDPLKKEMATHSSFLAWKIPWTEEPGRLQAIGSQRTRYNWVSAHTDNIRLAGEDRGLKCNHGEDRCVALLLHLLVSESACKKWPDFYFFLKLIFSSRIGWWRIIREISGIHQVARILSFWILSKWHVFKTML